MAHRAKSVSAKEILEKAGEAARAAFARRLPDLTDTQFEVGIFPDHGTCGIICPDFELGRVNGKDLYATAAHITEALGPLAQGAQPSVSIFDDILIFGYRPIGPVVFGDLR